MKQWKSVVGAAVIALLLIALMTDWLTVVISALAATPWWVYLVCVGILFCGYQVIRVSREDSRANHEWAEQEGDVYIRRMEDEKKKRRQESH